MRLVTYANGEQIGVGIQIDDKTYYTGYDRMLDLIGDGERGVERIQSAVKRGSPVSFDRLLAPIPRPGKMFGSGPNYSSHAGENPDKVELPEPRWDFIKLSSAVIGPNEAIVIPPHDGVMSHPDGLQVDYEVELGVVIGQIARNVSEANALDHVFGYTLFNDVSARAIQRKNRQVALGKGIDTFAPMGPCIVTRDELPNLGEAHLTTTVNGELRQDAYVREQVHPVPRAIEWLSSIITLEVGDCLLTGTPGGVGLFMDPPSFLKPGDTVTVRETTIGELSNPVVAGY